MANENKRLNIPIDDDLHKILKVQVINESTTIGKYVIEAIKEKLQRAGVLND